MLRALFGKELETFFLFLAERKAKTFPEIKIAKRAPVLGLGGDEAVEMGEVVLA